MVKDHIEVICPKCGHKALTDWPTPRGRRATVKCPSCAADFLIGEAVERTIMHEPDQHDLHLVPKEEVPKKKEEGE